MEPLCSRYCTETDHGYYINTAITQSHLSDHDLIAFLNYTCSFCGTSKDELGKTALHVAASCGRTNICKWLIECKQSKVEEKDLESGYTALHRSIFYGKLDTAKTLISLGANTKTLDNAGLNPLNHAVLDNLYSLQELNSPLIYAWGSNANYTLGTQHSRQYPDVMGCFHKKYPHKEALSIHLEKFHTVILTKEGEVLSFGLGEGGRLGLGTDKNILEPSVIKFPKHKNSDVLILKVALGRDHSLFLGDKGEVWACGLNTYHVLGIEPPPSKLLSPMRLSRLKSGILGICCSRYHSVAWNEDSVFTWGLNGGQLGHDIDRTQNPFLISPRKVVLNPNNQIAFVAASLGSTVIVTNKGLMIVFHNRQCRTIFFKQAVCAVEAYGGKVEGVDEKTEDLRVLALTKNGNLLVWMDSYCKMCPCIYSINRTFFIKHVKLNANGLVFITKENEVYNAKLRQPKIIDQNPPERKFKEFNEFLEPKKCFTVQPEQVPRIYGAKFITCDLEGKNFATLNVNYNSIMTTVPEISESPMQIYCRRLLEDSVLEGDAQIRVRGGRVYEVHKFMIANSSEKLLNLIERNVELDVPTEILEEILVYIYTRSCKFLVPCSLPLEIKKSVELHAKRNNLNSKDPLKLIQSLSKSLGLNLLVKDLENFTYSEGKIARKPDKRYFPRMIIFNHEDFPNCCDVIIKSTISNQDVKAHKCILACRCEYFMNMLSVRWSQEKFSSIELPYPIESIKFLLNYLYADQVNISDEDLDSLLNLLLLADHILLDRLVEICEFSISKLLTIKNALKILTVTDMCTASQLKSSCMEFICLNLAIYLEMHLLEYLSDDILLQLTHFYSQWNKNIARRLITPSMVAGIEDVIRDVCEKNPIDMDTALLYSNPPKSHRKRNRRKVIFSESNEDSPPLILTNTHNTNVIKEVQILPDGSPIASTPIRIKAISKAQEILKETSVEDDEDYVNLFSAKEFPNLANMSLGDKRLDSLQQKSPVTPNTSKKCKNARISQKERKRLLSESSESVKEVIAESPKNPWNKNFESSSPSSASVNLFGNILTEEKKQKENLNRMKSKLLIHTQMEDKAIEELSKFYGVDTVFDEIIEVQRVDCGLYAAPVWVQK